MIFLGRQINEQRNYSEKVAEAIDEEVRRIIETAHDRAREILSNHRDALERLARALIREETLEGEPLERVFRESNGTAPQLAAEPT